MTILLHKRVKSRHNQTRKSDNQTRNLMKGRKTSRNFRKESPCMYRYRYIVSYVRVESSLVVDSLDANLLGFIYYIIYSH